MQRTLIIEDSPETLDNISSAFKDHGIDVIPCLDIQSAEAAIIDNIPFDFVVLDWYFAMEGDSRFSKALLKKMNNRHFKPVFVYAGTIEDYNETPDDEIDFPRNLITGYSKLTTYDELREEISRKFSENYSLQLSETYRSCIHDSLEKILFELNSLQNVDIARILNVFFGDGSNVDWSSDLILNLLHRALISDSDFVARLSGILQSAVNINEGINIDDRKKIANKILYYQAGSDFIRNGDIVRIVNNENAVLFYGIVITPDCDLEQKKTLGIEMIEMTKIDAPLLKLNDAQKENIRKFNHDSLYYFPSVFESDAYTDFVAIIKSKIIVKEKTENYDLKYPSASRRHLYSHEYWLGSESIKMIPLCSNTNPYKSEFLQKLHSNNSRVGIPDIKKLF